MMDDKLREEILAKAPEILNDETLLRALIGASDKNLGSKIVDSFAALRCRKWTVN